MILWCILAFLGYGIIGIAPTGLFWVIIAGGFLLLFAQPIINTLYLTYVQTAVPKDKQGRVFSLDSLFSSIATPIGMILCVPLAGIIGIGNLFTICSVIGIVFISILTITKQFTKVEFDKGIENIEEKIIKEDDALLTTPVVD